MKITTLFRLSLTALFSLLLLAFAVISQTPAKAQRLCPADRPCITLYQVDNQLIAEWDGHDDYDAYNVRWSRPGKAEQQSEVEGGSNGSFTIKNVRAGVTYTIKVQACESNFLSSSDCTAWAEESYTTDAPPPAAPPPAAPQPSDWCIQGYVWREAVYNDHVCVTPETRSQAAYDNSQADFRRDPNGAYGPYTCIQGYVWREATPDDLVCVTPETRSQTAYDNSQAPYRVAR